MTARLAITIDYYQEGFTTALPILRALGIPATFYVVPSAIDTSGMPSSQQIADAQQSGNEIGIYSNANMVTMLGALSGTPPVAAPSNCVSVKSYMEGQIASLHAKGFEASTYAASSRQWNSNLANLARDLFSSVRVANDQTAFQQYPVVDPLYMSKGGANSWGIGQSGSDSPTAILARIDSLIANGGLGIEVIHKVGSVGDAFTFPTSDFQIVANGLASRIAIGALQPVTMRQAIISP